MSARDQMRAMLDQLMGTGRNGETDKFHTKFSDPKVCRSFLLSCCPYDILSLACSKIHDLALRADYEMAQRAKDYFYDLDALEHLRNFIVDSDRKTEIAKHRLKETQEELTADVSEKADRIHELAEKISLNMAKAEQLGQEGRVEESMKLTEEVEDLRQKKLEAEQDYRNSMPMSSFQQQKLRVCDVCSAFLGIQDNDRRLAHHFGGKLHLGYIEIREKLAELEKTAEKRKEERIKLLNRDRSESRRDRREVHFRDRDSRDGLHRKWSRRDRDRRDKSGRSKEIKRNYDFFRNKDRYVDHGKKRGGRKKSMHPDRNNFV